MAEDEQSKGQNTENPAEPLPSFNPYKGLHPDDIVATRNKTNEGMAAQIQAKVDKIAGKSPAPQEPIPQGKK